MESERTFQISSIRCLPFALTTSSVFTETKVGCNMAGAVTPQGPCQDGRQANVFCVA